MVTELEKTHKAIVDNYLQIKDKINCNQFHDQSEKNYYLGKLDALEFVLLDLGLVQVVYNI